MHFGVAGRILVWRDAGRRILVWRGVFWCSGTPRILMIMAGLFLWRGVFFVSLGAARAGLVQEPSRL